MNTIAKKKLGFWTLLSLVMGNMIGAGIFMLPASLAPYGSLSLIAWGVTTVGALLLALIFSRLTYRFPVAGGPYTYCRLALGNFIGFQVAWTYWVSMWVGSAATITAIISYLSFFIPALAQNPLWGFLASTALIWGLTFINIISLKMVGFVQILTTILKIVPLLLLIGFGASHISWENFQPFNPSDKPLFSSILSASILTMWTFIGIESATIPAHKVENPTHVIPKATLWGTGLVALFYIILSAFIIGLLPNDSLQSNSTPFALAATQVFGEWGGSAMAAIVIIASLGSLNGWFLIEAQLPAVAAQDGFFPKKFAHVNKNDIPVFSLIVTGALINILVFCNFSKNLVSTFSSLILLATLAILTTYLLSVCAEFILFLKEKKQMKPLAFIKNFLIVTGACIYIVLAIIGAGQEVILWGSVLFFITIPLYGFKTLLSKKQ